jgi:hypothetical protein
MIGERSRGKQYSCIEVACCCQLEATWYNLSNDCPALARLAMMLSDPKIKRGLQHPSCTLEFKSCLS